MFSMFDTYVKLDRLEKSVAALEARPRETGKILFYGDSMFTRWKPEYGNQPLEALLLGKDGLPAAVNHGIGGATAEELLFYYPRLVLPWKPRALVISAYPNDGGAGYSPWEVMFLKSRLLEYARIHMPGIRFYLLDAPVRKKFLDDEVQWANWQKRAFANNQLLEAYCREHEDCTFLSFSRFPGFFPDPESVGDYRKVRQELFLEDGVHFNEEGYALFETMIRQGLADIL